jgi:hypothetical protein
MLPQAPSGFSNYKRSKKLLVGAVGIEPTTFGLKVWFSLFQLFGISDLHSRYSVLLRLFGLFRGVFRTFSVQVCFPKPWPQSLSAFGESGNLRPERLRRCRGYALPERSEE